MERRDDTIINVEPAIEGEKNTGKDDPRLSWYPIPWGRYLYTSNDTIHRITTMTFGNALNPFTPIITTMNVEIETLYKDYQVDDPRPEKDDGYVHTKMNVVKFRKCFIPIEIIHTYS